MAKQTAPGHGTRRQPFSCNSCLPAGRRAIRV